jgi:hypothetical protein
MFKEREAGMKGMKKRREEGMEKERVNKGLRGHIGLLCELVPCALYSQCS